MGGGGGPVRKDFGTETIGEDMVIDLGFGCERGSEV